MYKLKKDVGRIKEKDDQEIYNNTPDNRPLVYFNLRRK